MRSIEDKSGLTYVKQSIKLAISRCVIIIIKPNCMFLNSFHVVLVFSQGSYSIVKHTGGGGGGRAGSKGLSQKPRNTYPKILMLEMPKSYSLNIFQMKNYVREDFEKKNLLTLCVW